MFLAANKYKQKANFDEIVRIMNGETLSCCRV